MSLLKIYRTNISRKSQELARLSQEKAKENAKIADFNKRIVDAKAAISRTNSESIKKSRLNDIARFEQGVAKSSKAIAELEGKLSRKQKELSDEEKKLQKEEGREAKKKHDAEKRHHDEQERQIRNISSAIITHERQQRLMLQEINKLKEVPQKITVLFLASNPLDSSRLRLDEECHSIQESIRKAEFRDSIKFESRWAVRPLDVLQYINELNPTIIHFSGHGADTGELIFQNAEGEAKFIHPAAMAQSIATATDSVRFMFLNACYSAEQAEMVTDYVDAAIGMSTSIGDDAACVFAAQFYSSLAFGYSVEKAYNQALAALQLESIPEENTPRLFIRNNINPSDLILVSPHS